MDGAHDMGGMDGFGKVEPEPNEPVFHHRWEGRVLAMSRAIGVFRTWTIDTSRYVIELLSPSVYLTSAYYERWFLRNVRLLTERGFIDADEVAAGRALRPGKPEPRPVHSGRC
jgi:nitrile hydratase